MSAVECFWLEETEWAQVWLRRYVFSDQDKCAASGYGYHNAAERIDDHLVRYDGVCDYNPKHCYLAAIDHPRTDRRWPETCACGYRFAEADEWQVMQRPLYRRGDGQRFTLDQAPAGAMWDAWWMSDSYRDADGISLTVRLPGGFDWPVDGPSWSNGKIQNQAGWARSGAAPRVTARPSILVPDLPNRPGYHGWLNDGVLVPC